MIDRTSSIRSASPEPRNETAYDTGYRSAIADGKARRIFAIVSTFSIPTSASRIMEASVDAPPYADAP
jgi:hypothetical protein